MLLTNRLGVTASSSRRVKVTALAGSASAFLVMNTRPVVVATHIVELSAVVRPIAPTAGPARSPHAALVSGVGPSRSKSPHSLPVCELPVHSLQIALASSRVRVPRPEVLVRYTVTPVPPKIVPLTVGSLTNGA